MLPRACRSVAALSMMMGLVAASHADDWGTVVAVSSTMGVHDGRVCVGEATRGDIGCPTYGPYVSTTGSVGLGGITAPQAALHISATAYNRSLINNTGQFPGLLITNGSDQMGMGFWDRDGVLSTSNDLDAVIYWGDDNDDSLRFAHHASNGPLTEKMRLTQAGRLGIGTQTPTVPLEVSGTVSATWFVGDGSGLTGVVAGSSDRIVSGSTSLLAVSSTGFVSLTQAGTNTGWFDPARGLVTLGVSATGGISGTRGYFGDGLTVSRSVIARGEASSFFGVNVNGSQILELGGALSASYLSNISQNSDAVLRSNFNNLILTARSTNGSLIFGTGATDVERMRIVSTGLVGIGTSVPQASLEVSGTISATYVKLADNDNLPCTAERNGTLRFSNGIVSICRAH